MTFGALKDLKIIDLTDPLIWPFWNDVIFLPRGRSDKSGAAKDRRYVQIGRSIFTE